MEQEQQYREKKLDEKPAREPSPDVPLREDVKFASSPVRCPYCHSDVSPESADWVSCKSCLARHHTACWGENGKCSTCSHEKFLSATPTRRAPAPRRTRAAVAAAVCGLAVALGVAAAIPVTLRASRERAVPTVARPVETAPAPTSGPGLIRSTFAKRETHTVDAWSRAQQRGFVETQNLYLDEYAEWLKRLVLDGYDLKQPTKDGALIYMKTVLEAYHQAGPPHDADARLMEQAIQILEKK